MPFLGRILFPVFFRTERRYSLHVCVDVYLAGSEIHGTRAPDLSRINPRVSLGYRAEKTMQQ